MRRPLSFLLALAALNLAAQQTNPMNQILLKDWSPDSSLVVPETCVEKPRFPAIDVHMHVDFKTPEEIARWVRLMDEVGVETTVLLTEAIGEEFDRFVDLYAKPHPGRFQLWCGLDIRDFENPDYPRRAAAELLRCYRRGARGVGELSDKGWGIMGGMAATYVDKIRKLPRPRRLHLDDPRLDLFWRQCAELKLPVNLHVADHPSAWRPPDNRQERGPSSYRWNQYGADVPSYEELLAARDRLLARHPATRFILCHFSNQGNDFAGLSKVMDRFPGLYLDLSARAYEFGRQPRSAVKFFEKYQDRILFGTDSPPGKAMYQGWWRVLESADDYIRGPLWWRLYGLDLRAPVLEAIYRGNARRILNWP
jgi:predicted TIM-barrel fold metal-dependent hydrolase